VGFTGAFERLRVRMTESDKGGVCAEVDGEKLATLDVTRSQYEQRQLPLVAGQTVAVGVRRSHVLPTPLSSYTVYARSPAEVETLKAHPLLVDLVTRMKTRVVGRTEVHLGDGGLPTANAAPLAGVAVIGADANIVKQLNWLLDRGARGILILPAHYTPPSRVLIHWTADGARRATLGVAASVLRHVPAEATYLNIVPREGGATPKTVALRELLDARSEAQAVHGLEMRTELHYGDAVQELTQQLAIKPDQMLILGVTDRAELVRRFASVLQLATSQPMLVVYRDSSVSAGQRQTA
jgi:hypothetical protein